MCGIASTWCYNVRTCAVFLLLGSCCLTYGKVLKKHGGIPIGEQMTPPIASLPQGTIRGVNMVSYRNNTFFAFKGIPYAKPPVGNLRFKDPVPPVIWNGSIDASRDPEPCVQFDPRIHKEAIGNEDCLFLNIYTPRLPVGNNIKHLPVMVFIFGGRFEVGNINSTRCDPRFILDRDVVLVLPSYRLGVLGFLSTGDEVLPGNHGLKDVVQALKWIQENVQYFGGDPNQVTLVGSSSGSIMVHLLTLSDLTDGLFHRYITQSGTAFSSCAVVPRSVSSNRANRLGQYFNCPTNSSNILVNCLKGLSASQLVKKTSMFREWGQYPDIVWNPTIEPDIDGAVLTDSPANLFTAGKIRDLPWIALVARDEGLHSTIVTNITQLIGDAIFTYPTYRAMKEHLIKAKNFQYFCSFEYRGRFSFSYNGGPPVNYGVSHADDLLYLLPGPKSGFGPADWEYSDSDWKMVDTMVQLWTSFATTGVPMTLDSDDSTLWSPFSSRDNYLRIGNGSDVELKVQYGFHKERMQFWDELTAATTWK